MITRTRRRRWRNRRLAGGDKELDSAVRAEGAHLHEAALPVTLAAVHALAVVQVQLAVVDAASELRLRSRPLFFAHRERAWARLCSLVSERVSSASERERAGRRASGHVNRCAKKKKNPG